MTNTKLEKKIDQIESIIWSWAKHATDTWKHNPTASSPFYGMNGVRLAIKNLVKTGKLNSSMADYDNMIKEGEKLRK